MRQWLKWVLVVGLLIVGTVYDTSNRVEAVVSEWVSVGEMVADGGEVRGQEEGEERQEVGWQWIVLFISIAGLITLSGITIWRMGQVPDDWDEAL
ncbi:MAG TPA: hypothetical protein VLL52_15050 [Anaerolineae bacterium]|nr:hypothetical protein [Anaerolineae bacterium]